jgi:hypothetical protein
MKMDLVAELREVALSEHLDEPKRVPSCQQTPEHLPKRDIGLISKAIDASCP